MKTTLTHSPLSLPLIDESKAVSRCPVHRALAWWNAIWSGFIPRSRDSARRVSDEAKPLVQSSDATASPRCPLGFGSKNGESAFVEYAEKEAAQAPALPGDHEANQLLEEARACIYHWPEAFPGFRGILKYTSGQQTWSTEVEVRSSRSYHFSLAECPDEAWVKFQLEELIAHREAPKRSRMASTSGVLMGDCENIYGQQVIFAGDKMGSYYRLKDKRITQIHRSYGGQSFVINIDQHVEHFGRFAARSYTAFYRDKNTSQLTKAETYLDDYVEVSGILLPLSRRFTETGANCESHRLISFSELALLQTSDLKDHV